MHPFYKNDKHPLYQNELRMRRLLRLRPDWFCVFRHRWGLWTDWEKDDEWNPNELIAVRWCGSCDAHEVINKVGRVIKGDEAMRLAEEKAIG